MINQIAIELAIDTSKLEDRLQRIKIIITDAIKAGQEMEECIVAVNEVLNFDLEQLRQLRKQVEKAYQAG